MELVDVLARTDERAGLNCLGAPAPVLSNLSEE